MKNSFTRLLRAKSLISKLTLLLATVTLSGSSAFAQYCTSGWTNAYCSLNQMFIGAVEISQSGTVLYSKANDQCNGSTTVSSTLVESTSAFTLTGGASY